MMKRKKTLNIGGLGLTYASANLGCQALSYSFLNVLQEIAEKNQWNIKFFIIDEVGLRGALTQKGYLAKLLPNFKCSNIEYHLIWEYYGLGRYLTKQFMKKCDIIFDFTAGDSFTDIYGQKRFEQRTMIKEMVLDLNIPLILGSQTIGPFNNKVNENKAVKVLQRCREVFVRDKPSYEYVKKISGREAVLTTDVAFALPFTKSKISSIKTIGINPSGLLWEGGYTKDNQFELTVDYCSYLRTIIAELLKQEYTVHLVPHVLTHLDSVDNDLIPCKVLKEEFPEIIVAPEFQTPMEAKSYVAGLDVFSGARMHATIAAYSAGVPVIPFSYSRKFEGLFNSLNYKYVISGCSDTQDKAISNTLNWINDKESLKIQIDQAKKIVEAKMKVFTTSVDEILHDII